ncbi:MAG: formylglycine-generating enzyme family protein [Pirellulales bacterium]
MLAAVISIALFAADPPASNAAPDELALLKTFRAEFIPITPGQGKFPAAITLPTGGGGAEQKSVTVRFQGPFEIAKYEVPQNLWEAVMGANPSRWQGPRNSVEMLSCAEAEEFCRRATAKMRAAKFIDEAQIVRLPSEAEWEYCARAGTTTSYSFGDDPALLDKHGWYTGNAKGNDPPVGAKAPNPWGLYDVHGYLWEWCADDWTDDVGLLPADGRPFAADGDDKSSGGALRGGSWKDRAEQLSSGFRRRADPTLLDDAVGLRCVLGRPSAERLEPRFEISR